MAGRACCAALLLSSLLIAGCGTATNLVEPGPVAGGKTPFGGVQKDERWIEQASRGELCDKNSRRESKQRPQVGLMLLCAADWPLSFVGDVLTWPYTASYTFINQPIPTPPVILTPNVPGTPAPEAVMPPASPERMPGKYDEKDDQAPLPPPRKVMSAPAPSTPQLQEPASAPGQFNE